MAATIERHNHHTTIRLEGECTVTSSAELKTLLLEGFASKHALRIGFTGTEELDITIMQLLWAAGQKAEKEGIPMTVEMPHAVAIVLRQAGFERFPGLDDTN